MQNGAQRKNGGAKRLIDRLDRASGDFNAFLLTLAIGLAVLDFTCFFAFEVRSALPSPARVSADASVMQHPLSPAFQQQQQAIAALSPTRPAHNW